MTAASTDAGRIEAADTGIKVVVVEDDEVERCCHELGRLAVINEFVYNSGRFSYVETKTAFPRLPTNCRLFLDVCGSVQRLHRERRSSRCCGSSGVTRGCWPTASRGSRGGWGSSSTAAQGSGGARPVLVGFMGRDFNQRTRPQHPTRVHRFEGIGKGKFVDKFVPMIIFVCTGVQTDGTLAHDCSGPQGKDSRAGRSFGRPG
ncbi:hypothetical protein G6O67_006613 [Ophiocordyceps sinensis]|uniref:Uncharacterized protein n=1 Tax=Ophiocordyceps sinensis TaxID=72228 RepID=A0A8H4LX40_9HYPO|nr:hypothetical protein G6O67_006613 [Ophiocordyceps sinensis]